MTWPFENDTSAITKKLAQRSFKANKLRNIVAVIAIVLTSMLFTSVTTLCVGAIQSIQTTILQIRGTSPSTGTSVNWIAIIAALFFIMIFVITGYLLIRNIFEISVVQEIKKYGLLRTIGTTEKQIKRIVYKQAFWLSIIGISIGLILGYIVGIFMLPWILNFMKGEYHNLSVNLSFNPIIFVVAGIFSAITVWVSIKKPFKIAATISPIEATRYYEKDNYHSANKNRLSFKNRITEMAWRNLRRNSKRTIFIVLSMILCIILLNSAIAIGNSVDVKKYVSSVTSFDFVVASPNTFSNVQGFRFKDDSVSNEIISDIENNIPVLNGSRIYKNTLDDVSVTYDYGSLVTEVFDFALMAGVIAIVLIGGYIVIQSIFRISINDKIKSYGQLRTIGATPKQIKRIVKREGRKLGSIGILIGTVLGVCGGFLLFPKGFNAVSYVAISLCNP